MHRRIGPMLLLALVACAPAPAPRSAADFARLESRNACNVARAEDFRDDGAAELQHYVGVLARTRGGAIALAPADVSLSIVGGELKPSPPGVHPDEDAF